MSNVGKDLLIQRRRLDIVISMRVLPFYLDPVPSTLADFPAVFFHICHGTQQAVVTAYRAYQNV